MIKSEEISSNLLEDKRMKLQKRSQDHFQTYTNYKFQSQKEMEERVSKYVDRLNKKRTEDESFSLIKIIFLNNDSFFLSFFLLNEFFS